VLSEQVNYVPTNRNAVDLLPARLAGSLPPRQTILAVAAHQHRIWIEHGDALERRFHSWAPAICASKMTKTMMTTSNLPVCQDAQGKMRISHAPVSAEPHWPTGNPSE